MKFTVSKEAAQWFIDEMDLEQGDYVQFFVKIYGGIPTAHPNYFLGISVGKEKDILIQDEVNGVTFYFTSQDAWFLEEYEMEVVGDTSEVKYIFNKIK
ncbi:HesB/YadR/YfhF family protein [Bacillus niameyensis]|uniref:HesB/YadR/YfhF family protein n=1 Tax=Bacillus niameyensis TaxID=1522308 RepID=UPI0007830726|nr:hypothetical protein [Bacillus niameyensis]